MTHQPSIRPLLTRLIGRRQELTALAELLTDPDVRLVTICGAGGIGKTRLALEIIDRVQGEFDDGVLFIDLVPITNPALIPEQLLAALGADIPDSTSIEEFAIEQLEDKRLLVVLDNMEHLRSAAPFVARLLERCADVAVLATSRERLGIPFERTLDIAPLPVPDQHAPQTLASVMNSESVQLFIDRARMVDHEHELTQENVEDVAAICRRLDGLPLAIELAAARVAEVPPRLILRNFARILPFLERASDDPQGRHRTMINAIAWSYGLLSADEQTAFRSLAVFQSSFSVEAALAIVKETLCDALGQDDLLVLLASLTGKHLLVRRTWQGDEPRFEMLQTMREFGQDQLIATNELDRVHNAYAAYLTALADRLRLELRGQRPGVALARYTLDHDEFRAALAWLIGHRPVVDTSALLLCNNLANFWLFRGHAREGKAWYLAALAQAGEAVSIEHATAYLQLGHFTYDDHAAAYAYYGKGLELYKQLGHAQGTAGLTISLALAARHLGRYDESEALLNQGLSIFEDLDNDSGIANASFHLATLMELRGDFPAAVAHLDEARNRWEHAGDAANAVNAVFQMGKIHRRRGEYDRAESLLKWSMARRENEGIEFDLPALYVELGFVAAAREDIQSAYSFFSQAISITQRTAVTERFAESMTAIADLAIRDGQADIGVELLSGIDRWCTKTGYHRDPEELEFARLAIKRVKAAMSDDAFSDAWSRGTLRSDRELLQLAQGLQLRPAEPSQPTQNRAGPSNTFGLTHQEQVVLCLLARGMTNQQVADALSNSVRTIAVHVQNILRKLDAENRTHASAIAHHAGLCDSQ